MKRNAGTMTRLTRCCPVSRVFVTAWPQRGLEQAGAAAGDFSGAGYQTALLPFWGESYGWLDIVGGCLWSIPDADFRRR